jgi:hypothetical protein
MRTTMLVGLLALIIALIPPLEPEYLVAGLVLLVGPPGGGRSAPGGGRPAMFTRQWSSPAARAPIGL